MIDGDDELGRQASKKNRRDTSLGLCLQENNAKAKHLSFAAYNKQTDQTSSIEYQGSIIISTMMNWNYLVRVFRIEILITKPIIVKIFL